MNIKQLRWVLLPNGLWRLEHLNNGPDITQAVYDSLPGYLKAVPTPSVGWVREHYYELMARMAGGKWSDLWALQLIKTGTPATDAVKLAASTAPAAKPAVFPRLAELVEQSGEKQAAQILRTGFQTPSPASGTSALVSPQTGSTTAQASMPSPALLIGLGLLFVFATRQRGRR